VRDSALWREEKWTLSENAQLMEPRRTNCRVGVAVLAAEDEAAGSVGAAIDRPAEQGLAHARAGAASEGVGCAGGNDFVPCVEIYAEL
jgi:hypothetical protein